MKTDEKNSIAIIKQELAKLKASEDEKIKSFYDKVTDIMVDLSKTPPTEEKAEKKDDDSTKDDKGDSGEDKKEDSKDVEGKDGKKDDKPVDDNKKSEKKEEEEKVEEVVREKTEEKKDDKKEKELGADLTDKLAKVTLELSNLVKDVSTKDELLKVKDVKITELSAELEKYKAVEQLELSKRLDVKYDNLLELYKTLGIEKDILELKNDFSEGQVDQLIIDMSAMTQSNVKPTSKRTAVRKTGVSVDLELSKYTKTKVEKEMSEAERAEELFFN